MLFCCFEKSLKCAPLCPKFLHLNPMSSLQRNVDFPDILLQNRAPTRDIKVVSQAEMRMDGWMARVKAYEGDLYVNLLTGNTLLHLWICSPNKIFNYNTRAYRAKAYKGFDPLPHFLDLSALKILADCLTQQSWICISPAFDFWKLESLYNLCAIS